MLFNCKECEKEISHTAGKCPNCGCKKPFKGIEVLSKDIKGWDSSDIRDFTKSGGAVKRNFKLIKYFFLSLWILFIALIVIGINEESKLTPEQKAAREAERVTKEEKDVVSTMNAEFYSMRECLQGIKKNSGYELDVVTDKADNVSGFLSNGEGFGCQKKSTGTKGTYYEGWFFTTSK